MKGPPVKISQRKLFCKVGKLSHGWGNYKMDLDWGCSGEYKTYMLFGKFGPDGGYMFRDQSVNVVRAFLSLAEEVLGEECLDLQNLGSPKKDGMLFSQDGWHSMGTPHYRFPYRTSSSHRMIASLHLLSILEHFCNPASISLAPTKWQKFTSNLMVVLNTFEAQPLSDEEGNANNLEEEAATFSIKYLTSSKLMGLELKDPSFRRHILVQCLILFDYLKAPGKNDKDLPSDSMGGESTHYILRLAYGSSLQNNKGLGCDGIEILDKAHSMEEAIPLNTLIRITLSSLLIYFMSLFVISNKKDRWYRDLSLEEFFPTLFFITTTKDTWEEEGWEQVGEKGRWSPRFSRQFRD
ncbi:THO complex subunit 1 [Vitis vinifera]|uniref:THO complex subunit 1 n=1 Tax=Vitis vinifera TaxID=29760 RepID=A0A438IJS1_VITVI|nr:THO complex subunit 1 [Vitis vinifera]